MSRPRLMNRIGKGVMGLIPKSGKWIAFLLILTVKGYQKTLAPLVPFHCRFRPTCSHYFIEVIQKHGVIRGLALGLWRLARCQPLCRGGDDPVP